MEYDVNTSSIKVNNTQFDRVLHNNSDTHLLSSLTTTYSNVDKEYKSYTDNNASDNNSYITSSYLEKEKKTSVANWTHILSTRTSTNHSFYATYKSTVINNILENIQNRSTMIPVNQVFQQLKTNSSYNKTSVATHDITKSVTESPSLHSISTRHHTAIDVSTNTASFEKSSTPNISTVSYSEAGNLNISICGQSTVVPITSTISAFKNISFNIGLRTDNDLGKNRSTSTLDSTSFFQTSELPNPAHKSNYVNNNFTSYPHKDHMSTNILTSTITSRLTTSKEKKIKTIKSSSPVVKNYTVFFHNSSRILPQFHNSTTSTTNQIYSVDDKVNNSHTHLQTISQLPIFYSTTKESVLATSVGTNMTQPNYITVSSPKKWKSVYKPKGKSM